QVALDIKMYIRSEVDIIKSYIIALLTVIVKKADNGSVWNLKENIAFDTIGDTGNYVIKEKGDPGKSKITCEDGIKIVQTSNAAMVENDTLKERPTITVDFSDKIKAGKKYYVETEINSNMLKGETRIMMMNSTAGEGAYIMPGSAATYFLTAKYNGKRDWVSSVVNMPLVKNTNERVGILFDSATNKLKFCRNGETASDIWFETSYGSGLSGISFSFWGAADGKDSSIIIKNVKVYECNSELDEKYKSDVESLVYEKITPQSKDVILSDLTLPKTLSNGSTVTWSSSDVSTISADGKVTRPETSDKSVTLTATISGFGETVVKDFVFNVVASNNLKAGFDADLERLIPASLTDEEPTKITKDLKTLPKTLFYGTNVTWETSDNTVIDETGRITRKVNQNSSAKLTATLTKGNLNAKKEFDFIVLGNIIVVDGNVAFGVNSFSNAKSETENKNDFVNDSNYSTMWFTNDGNSEPSVTLDFGKSVIFSKAKLYEVRDGEEYRVKNAVLETSENGKDFVKVADVGAVGDKKEVNFAIQKARYLRYRVIEKSAGNTGLYEFEVFYNPTDSDVVKKDSETFNFDIPYKISENVELPKITEYGSEIIWTSSNPAVFGNDGVVTRAKENTPITLTVKFKKGEAIAEGVKRTLMVLGTNPEKPTRPPSGGGGNGGGNNNGGTTGSVVITPPINTQDEPEEISPFSDVSTDKWSYSYIKSLYEKEIISGDENGEFKPEANMHRE
ncbi:MAG: discoidin domain-containing protein, partial [Oscillospiraceae bacterium]